MSNIPGIQIRSFSINEIQSKCNITISFSDIDELSKRTIADRPANPEFRELFLDTLVAELKASVDERKKRNVENAS